jgi:hypothetical protein
MREGDSREEQARQFLSFTVAGTDTGCWTAS